MSKSMCFTENTPVSALNGFPNAYHKYDQYILNIKHIRHIKSQETKESTLKMYLPRQILLIKKLENACSFLILERVKRFKVS